MRILSLLAVAALALACGGDDLTLPNEGQPAELAAVRGNGQNGTVGAPLADSLVVRVLDRFGSPIGGIEVSWTAEVGGSVNPATAVTDADGRAGTQRTLGPQPGTYTTVATVAQLPEEPAVFTTTGVAAKLSLVTQPSPSAVSGVPLERQPVIQLLDADANPVARQGVVVTVQIATGGGSLGGSTSVASDPNGLVAFTDLSIRGEPGNRTLLFAADAFASTASAPVAVGVGAAASIAIAAGEEQSAMVSTAVSEPPAAVVRDLDGNPVAGIPVTFSVISGGGSVTGGTVTTGPDGVARVGSWTLGSTAGPNSLQAQVQGLELQGSPVTFTATGTAGPLSLERSTIAASPGTIAASTGAVASTITVTARDAFDNPIPGLDVVLSATGAGNVLTQPAEPTDPSGTATGQLAATGLGAHVVSATIAGQAIQATATVTVTGGSPAAGNSQAGVPNGVAGRATVIEIRLGDAFGNPVAGAPGAIAVAVSGANPATGLPVEEVGGGLYRVRYTPTVAGTDLVSVQVNSAAVTGSPFTSQVAPGPVDPASSTAQVSRTPSIFTIIDVLVTARDAQG
ncbi:MAG: Ig-like domain-containing protein, partial [Gemmatimonadales bacterium]|nr:Ig-like domain-containing protein [Gemmatimonadales bacterium]